MLFHGDFSGGSAGRDTWQSFPPQKEKVNICSKAFNRYREIDEDMKKELVSMLD
jgi:hypothetical protein